MSKDGRVKREPATMRDRTKQLSTAKRYITDRVAKISDPELRSICINVVASIFFEATTASRQQHQAYDGGLMVHTAEVMEIATNIAASRCMSLDMDVVTAAIVFHDIGKAYDYIGRENGIYEYTPHKRLIGHLPRSYAVFMEAAVNLTDDLKTQIGHCILSHHGRQEWGSPVVPQTPEAYVVHCADWMSADATVDYWE